MAYRDPNLKKNNVVKVRLDSYVNREIEALCDFTGGEKAAVMRDLIELALREFHSGNSASVIDINKGSNGGLQRAS